MKMKFLVCNFLFATIILCQPLYSMDVKIGVILPANSSFPWSYKRVSPAIDLAVETINAHGILPGFSVRTFWKDSGCSETTGPLAAMELYMIEQVHVFLGPVCDYAAAPVARFSPHWNLPVITAGAHVSAFDDKSRYKLLTRVHESHSNAADFVNGLANYFNWNTFGIVYEDATYDKSKSKCFFRVEAIYHKLKQMSKNTPWYKKFSPDSGEEGLRELLRSASLNARIILLCGSPDSIRNLMIAANDLQFVTGEYVFLNIQTEESEDTRPWYREQDTVERNNKARLAYQTLLKLSVRRQNSQEYRMFSNEVKRRAITQYEDVTFGEGEVNSYIGAFHDAMLLYALALNETIEAGEMVTDGEEVTKRMWNKVITGITGTLSIDENGDRTMDYSILDMDSTTGSFQVVMNYYGLSKTFAPVPGSRIDWGPDYDMAPPDTPKCGFDTSGCPEAEEAPDSAERETSRWHAAKEMIETMQNSLAQVSEAIEEHKGNLEAMAKFIEEEAKLETDSSQAM